jgi:hypothetical protein
LSLNKKNQVFKDHPSQLSLVYLPHIELIKLLVPFMQCREYLYLPQEYRVCLCLEKIFYQIDPIVVVSIRPKVRSFTDLPISVKKFDQKAEMVELKTSGFSFA